MSGSSAISPAKPAPPQKLRIHCSSCNTLCEVQVPAVDPNRKKAVRFQIKCPKCGTLNEMRTGPPPGGGQGGAPPAAPGAAGQKRKADETALGPPTNAPHKKPAEGASSSAAAPKNGPGSSEPPKPPPKPPPQAPPKPAPKPAKAAAAPKPTKAAAAPKAPKQPSASAAAKSSARGSGAGGRGGGRARPSSRGTGASGRAASTSGTSAASSIGANGEHVTAEDLDDFIIEEASERLPTRERSRGARGGPTGRLLTVGAKPHVTAVSAFDRAFPALSVGAPASCELAYEQARFRPRWREHDEVEVAFKGKGFEGSWAAATVVKPDGRKNVLVRYSEFVDNDATPLVEQGRPSQRACTSRMHFTHAPHACISRTHPTLVARFARSADREASLATATRPCRVGARSRRARRGLVE